MNANVENLVLEQLKAIRAGLTRVEEDIREIKLRLTTLEHGQAHFFTSYAQQQSTLDRLDQRVTRIEKRLELVDEIPPPQ